MECSTFRSNELALAQAAILCSATQRFMRFPTPKHLGVINRPPHHRPHRHRRAEVRMTLPPELIDEILTDLRDDKPTLRNCSLIAKSWVYPSQKLLYAHVHLTPETHRIWQENSSPTSAELLQHVRTLKCHNFHSLEPSHGDYFGSLHCLERLAFCELVPVEPNITNLFSAFQTTLLSLSLSHVFLTWAAFTTVVDYFPNLRDLHVTRFSFVGDVRSVPPLSRPPRGKLRLSSLSRENISVLSNGLSASELRYDELEIVNMGSQTPSRTRSIISACGGTLKRLVLALRGRKFQCHTPRGEPSTQSNTPS